MLSERAADPLALGAEKLFAAYRSCAAVLLAISGGPDSMALLLLARRWAAQGGPRLVAATVDHGLRPGSRAEARQVGAWCIELGTPHRLLAWEGEKPKTRIQERAREARYALLEGCAREIGAEAVLTAHHADDQAETVLLRLLRGSGLAGLAGMAATIRRSDGLMIGRPLLALRKAELIGLCEALGQPFVLDPSNEDPRFARTALRSAAALLRESGLGVETLLRLAARAARADAALASAAAGLAAEAVIEQSERSARYRADPLLTASEELSLRVVAKEIQRISGVAHLRLQRAESLTLRLREGMAAGRPVSATLGGVALRLRKGVLGFEKENRPQRKAKRPSASVQAQV